MDDLTREKKKGLRLIYLIKAAIMRKIIGDRYQTPGFGFAALLFSSMAKEVIDKLGADEGEELIRRAVESFGRERGRRIAETVLSKGMPLSLRNWIIYTDIAGGNFPAKVKFPDADLEASVGACSFMEAADRWGMREYAALYCKYADYAILNGYNPDVKLTLKSRHETGHDHCVFRYRMKQRSE
jgi:hypothetical protein